MPDATLDGNWMVPGRSGDAAGIHTASFRRPFTRSTGGVSRQRRRREVEFVAFGDRAVAGGPSGPETDPGLVRFARSVS